MRYSLKQMAVFDAVADLESVSAAAKKLALTQSAVSMSLSQLESLLDRPLFIRQGNRLVLSHWGAWLRPKAKQLLQDAKQIELGLHDQQLISGSLRVGASQTAAEHLIPDLISRVDTDFPELRIELMVDNTEHVIDGLLNYDFDLGIIESRNDDSRIHQETWLDDHLVVIAAAHHPFARHETVHLAQLEQAKWVLREQGSGIRQIFDGAVHGLIDNLNVWKEYEQVKVLKTLVKNSHYLSCIPYLDAEQAIKDGDIVALHTPQLDLRRTLAFIWRYDSGENPLRSCVLSAAKRLVRRREREIQQAFATM
ncbi:LysR substrate-binding domain-containing protein [Motilimonas pumila]|uniref:LysR family transcriptional regulator n=1 Tax=Motilimonas pumila TaxID=2303987 RepID=A0A418YBG5_9GAMM|nr:LysR substrate-binding domain-containing protein [Motilimonas pumila]RJG40330.1 LysR family transcriptional regulator [Motilimonas pumila]